MSGRWLCKMALIWANSCWVFTGLFSVIWEVAKRTYDIPKTPPKQDPIGFAVFMAALLVLPAANAVYLLTEKRTAK